ncbi:hypothetical protein [Marinicrinis sediminis]|uniref:Protein kinase domain-containing protein n=1 Tax=Marinicrinis sediminis TaxID=1652465 RepID=A0ABW5RGF4_9BACL
MMDVREWVNQVQLHAGKQGDYIRVQSHPSFLQPIGVGRSAAVFRLEGHPRLALKIFHPLFWKDGREEASAYRQLGSHLAYPRLHEANDGYLLLDYIDGMTFYQCLIEGVPITEEMVAQVDEALSHAETKGLFPSDIHLKNILLTPDQNIIIIDLARFSTPKACSKWSDLKKAYDRYYATGRFPKRVPERVLIWIMNQYRHQGAHFSAPYFSSKS